MTKEIISYDTFAKLDIVLGEIIAVEIVENADKLLRLSVEVGEMQPRQIISGIREFFEDPQSLVGIMCSFIINLEPRMIKGYESQGMILAASSDERLALLTPTTTLPLGTRIC